MTGRYLALSYQGLEVSFVLGLPNTSRQSPSCALRLWLFYSVSGSYALYMRDSGSHYHRFILGDLSWSCQRVISYLGCDSPTAVEDYGLESIHDLH